MHIIGKVRHDGINQQINMHTCKPAGKPSFTTTTDFAGIYQTSSGKSFRHGSVYIYEGKLYYDLMEHKSGNKQPIYLQIIDVDIAQDISPN